MNPWPWVCESCDIRYAAFRVYARAGFHRCEWTVCEHCGPHIPEQAVEPRGGWQDVHHCLLRPVPAAFDPVSNPYPTDARPAMAPPPVYEKFYEREEGIF